MHQNQLWKEHNSEDRVRQQEKQHVCEWYDACCILSEDIPKIQKYLTYLAQHGNVSLHHEVVPTD